MPITDNHTVVRLRDYAQLVGVSYRTAYRLYRNGELPGRKLGGSIIVIPDVDPSRLDAIDKKLDQLLWLLTHSNGRGHNNGAGQ